MSARRYQLGLNRPPSMLLPPRIEDDVTETNRVRAIDADEDSLDLAALEFQYTDAGGTRGGQPADPPGVMLKFYGSGYMNPIRSSRWLEKEARRNIDLVWLLRGVTPSHTTIGQFRKDNLNALKQVHGDFVPGGRELDLFGGEEVGMDGTFMPGNASQASIYSQERLAKQVAKLDQAMDKYLAELEPNDQTERAVSTEELAWPEKLERLKAGQAKTQQIAQSGDPQGSETDPDARRVAKSSRATTSR